MREVDILDIIVDKIENAFILATFYDKVLVGKYRDKKILFNEDVNYELLNEIRFFNKDKEIRINKYGVSIVEDENDIFIDEAMFIVGNKVLSKNDNFTRITRLNRIVDIPSEVDVNNVKLVVRNYIEEDSVTKQFIITKSRLVDIRGCENHD